MDTKFAATAAAPPPELPPAICNTVFIFSSFTSIVLARLQGFTTGPKAPQLATLKSIHNDWKIVTIFQNISSVPHGELIHVGLAQHHHARIAHVGNDGGIIG